MLRLRIDAQKKILIKTLSLMEDNEIFEEYDDKRPKDLELKAS